MAIESTGFVESLIKKVNSLNFLNYKKILILYLFYYDNSVHL